MVLRCRTAKSAATTASSERTGEMSSPVATMVPPDSLATPLACGSLVAAGAAPVDVAAAATFCTSLGSAGAACVVVVDATASFFAQPNGSSATEKIEIVMMKRFIAVSLPLQRLL